MTKEKALFGQFTKAVDRLREVLREPKTAITRDSAIKRFEIAFDLCWKTVKEHLNEKKGVVCAGPKDTFRAAYKHGLLEYEDYWLTVTDQRNLAAHTYQEQLAEDIYEDLQDVLEHFEALVKRMEE